MAKQINVSKQDLRLLFGSNLAKLRKEIGLSQEQLALESGIARSYLGGVERGQRNIAIVNIAGDVPIPRGCGAVQMG